MAIKIRNMELKNKVLGAVGSSPSVIPSLRIEGTLIVSVKQNGCYHLCAFDIGTCDDSHLRATPFMFVF